MADQNIDWAISTTRDTRTARLDAPKNKSCEPEQVPSRIGRYMVIDHVGSGANGSVYSAYDPDLDRRVAIKCLRSSRTDSEAGERLRREAQALARLSHPNVVTVYDVGDVSQEKPHFFIAMAFVEGMNLTEWLRARERPWREVLDLLLQAGRGLAAAHGAGLLHRDFKPDNVLVTGEGQAQVADFGLACAVQGAEPRRPIEAVLSESVERSDLKASVYLVGSPAYMAPETLRNRVDERSDQFSFCAALFEALYGVRPHLGAGLPQLFNAKLEGALTPVEDHRGAPRWLYEAVVRGLSPDPEDRWPSLDELIATLERRLQRQKNSILAAAALLAVGLVAGIGVTAAMNDSATICDRAPAPWSGVWDDGRKKGLQEAFSSSGLDFAPSTFERVSAGLDTYTGRWSESRQAFCQEQQAGRLSDLDLHRQMACIAERHQEIKILVDIFAQGEPDVVEQSIAAIDGLESPEECATLPQLARGAEEIGASLELRQRLASIRSHFLASLYAEAAEAADAVVEEVRELGDMPLLSEALYEYARSQI
ncbi:MAG: serine/threonine-protein kinase, partial [Acidobacteriota bacterium]